MFKYALKRILTFIPMLIAISLLSFVISINAPGDPVERLSKAAGNEGSAEQQSGASKKIKQELRKKLGLDLPIFYLSVTDLAASDTLYKVQDKYHKANLEALTHQSGNWQAVSDYYSSLLALQKAHQQVDAKAIVANNSLLSLNSVNESANQFGFEIGSLLETSDKSLVTLKFEKMNGLLENHVFLSDLKAPLFNVKQTRENLLTNTTRWKTYIPAISWYGAINQYHLWLFGDQAYCQIYYPFEWMEWFKSKNNTKNNTFVYSIDMPIGGKSVTHTRKGEDKYGKYEDRSKKSTIQVSEKKWYGLGDAGNSSLGYKHIFRGEGKVIGDKLCDDSGFSTICTIITSGSSKQKPNPIKPKKLIFAGFNNLHTEGSGPRYGLLRGDFGISYIDSQPIESKIWQKVGISFSLSIISIFLAYLISIPIGIYSAYKKDSAADKGMSLVLFVLYSMPSFFVATLLLLQFANPDNLSWFPVSGIQDPTIFDPNWSLWMKLKHRMPFLILPIITYTYGSFAFLSRIMRVGMIDVVSQDYIRTARAKGLGEGKVILKHALRNSLLPVITVFAAIFPMAIGGSIIIEVIFSIPGMGVEVLNSILNYDYPMIITVFTLSGFLTMVGYLVADLLYAVVDPRISYK